MLRISKLADYATIIMDHLTKTSGKLYSAKSIAESVNIAQTTVSKVLKGLVKAHLVSSECGTNGGYQLAYPANKISIAKVIAAIDGQSCITDCCANKHCPQSEHCPVKDNWKLINRTIHQLLDHLTLEDMTKNLAEHPLMQHLVKAS